MSDGLGDKLGDGYVKPTDIFGINDRLSRLTYLKTNGTVMYIVYALLAGFVLTTIVLIVDAAYPFLPGNPVGGPSAMARAGKTYWSLSDAAQNLIIPSGSAPPTVPTVWSVLFQFTLQDSRSLMPVQTAVFRHIVHRGTNPYNLTATAAGPTGHAGLQLTDLPPTAESSYRKNGLPAIMCPGVMLDPFKNDIHIFMHTLTDEKALLLESATIADVPLEQPMAIGLICNGKVLEIYVNCRLYDTLLLKGRPYLPPTAMTWFGRYGVAPAQGLLHDITLWSGALVSKDFLMVCRVSSQTSAASDTPSCPTAILHNG